MRLSRREFEDLIVTALASVPEQFRAHLENVEILVEDRPTAEDLEEREGPEDTLLLGIYRGVPLTQQSVWATSLYPHRIVIFQRSFEQLFRTREEMVVQVRRTVIHEIAHHFGISDERLGELGAY